MSVYKRLCKELRDLDENPHSEFSASPVDYNNLLEWKANIFGPKGTPYEGGIWFMNVKFPTDYPFKPPKVEFKTKIYHP